MWSTCLSNIVFGWNHWSDSLQSAADLCAITLVHSKKNPFLQTSCSKDKRIGCVQRCSWFSYCKLSMCCLEDESDDISSLVATSVLRNKPQLESLLKTKSPHIAVTHSNVHWHEFTNKKLHWSLKRVMSTLDASHKFALVSLKNYCLFRSVYQRDGSQKSILSNMWRFISYYEPSFIFIRGTSGEDCMCV